MIKVAVIGALGRMGRSISSLVLSDSDLQLVGSTEAAGHPEIGKNLSNILGFDNEEIFVEEAIEKACENADVIVDFTTPENTLHTLNYAKENNKAVVIGTTGFDADQKKEFDSLASSIPCVFSPNMSIGVNVLFEISKQVAGYLGDSYDIEIVETHHKNKVDAPSGTALGLGNAVAEGRGIDLMDKAVFERYGNTGQREKGTIGLQTLRGGDAVSYTHLTLPTKIV